MKLLNPTAPDDEVTALLAGAVHPQQRVLPV